MTDNNNNNKREENIATNIIPLEGWRKNLAERMINSHLNYAAVTQMREIDVTELINLRQSLIDKFEKTCGFRLSYTHLIIKASAEALRKHSIINSSIENDKIRIWENINIAIAVALENGQLLAPVIKQVDTKSILEVAQEAKRLIEKVKTKRFSLDIFQDGTFTVSNAGMYGTDFVTPLINAPQSAALGVGRMVPKPVVRNNKIVIRTIMGLSLTYDHRVLSGAIAAQFFQTLEYLIQNPSKIDLKLPFY